ncbi:MAG: Flp pilus assembly complex ATPase component TadA, partial [Deltaproteobacteria bacterium]|nr:Flp pilus assembly complex ATPase component TadA [Deltaproteobacteria bacterium]
LSQALAQELGLPFLDPLPRTGDMPVALLREVGFDFAFARQRQVIPVRDEPDGSLLVALGNPLDTVALDDLRMVLQRELEPVAATPSAVLDAINRAQQEINRTNELTSQGAEASEERTDILESDEDAQIIRWVNSLFVEAVKERASDIHIQPDAGQVAVRYRIDGRLYQMRTAPKSVLPSIVARVKIMSGLNIAEKRLPQDGRIGFKIGAKEIDIRVSTIPIGQGVGERIVMRILNKASVMLELTDLGFAPDRLEKMHDLIGRPEGIILVTGPTGSGKTTTLYACLNKINTPDVNILTAEDPIEYDIAGLSQMQVNPRIGLTFASCLRAFLRQDPDVVMVGEIRDKETAEIAVHASLTGHLVLSTIHTNDAAGAVTRLVEMGIENFHLTSSLLAILAQRLVRVLCPLCKEPYTPREVDLARIGIDAERLAAKLARPETRYGRSAFGGSPAAKVAARIAAGAPVTLYRARGCAACQNTGYQGRTGIYELLLVSDAVRSLVLRNVDSPTIRRAAVEEGMDTLRDDGIRKVFEGHTTLEEVLAATQDDV